MQSLTSQFYAFLVTVLIGITVGMLFDCYKVLRGLTRPKKAFTYLGDLAFWVISTLVVFFMLLIGNWGEIRFYVIIGVFAGSALYMKCFSKGFLRMLAVLISICKKIINVIQRLFVMLWVIVTYPLIIIRNVVIIPVGFLGTTFLKSIRWVKGHVFRMTVTPVKRSLAGLYNKVKRVFKK